MAEETTNTPETTSPASSAAKKTPTKRKMTTTASSTASTPKKSENSKPSSSGKVSMSGKKAEATKKTPPATRKAAKTSEPASDAKPERVEKSIDFKATGAVPAVVKIDDIGNGENMRDKIPNVKSMMRSIADSGLLQNLCVTEAPEGSPTPYILNSGFRRMAGIKMLREQDPETFNRHFPDGVVHVSIIKGSDEHLKGAQVAENLSRQDPTLRETAAAAKGLYDAGVPVEDVARYLGTYYTVRHAQQLINIGTNLVPEANPLLDENILSHKIALELSTREPSEQKAFVRKVSKVFETSGKNKAKQAAKDELGGDAIPDPTGTAGPGGGDTPPMRSSYVSYSNVARAAANLRNDLPEDGIPIINVMDEDDDAKVEAAYKLLIGTTRARIAVIATLEMVCGIRKPCSSFKALMTEAAVATPDAADDTAEPAAESDDADLFGEGEGS